jgi:hypothetical protein
MAGLVEVFARVVMRAGVTAPDVTTGQAHPQMCPRILTELVAFLAFAGRARLRLGRRLRVGCQVLACLGGRRGGAFALA